MTWQRNLRWYHWFLLILALVIYWMFFAEGVFAQNTTPIIPGLFEDGIRVGYDAGGIKGFVETAEQGLKMLYLIFWPLLAVAAAAMDNSLVYGGAFYLTNALFKFWQIIRTFANYTIGLYFVGSILVGFFGNKLEKGFSDLIKNVAIAAILVNMSWWIIAALIDLSTLATFSLGALPLHALGDDQTFKENVYYMKTYNNINLNTSTAQNADKFDFSIMYGCTEGEGKEANTTYYLPCAVNNKGLFYQGKTDEPLTRDQYKEDFKNVRKNDTKVKVENISDDFCVYDKQLIKNQYGAAINDCKILQDLMVKGKDEAIKTCATVDKLVTKAVNNSGPLLTIFSSILNMSEMGLTTNSGSVKEVGLNLLIKLVFGIALIIPLIALAVVMVIRVVYLWLIIAFSPLITIAVALQRGEKAEGKIDGVLKNVLKPTQIVSLIFLPVIATFGLSISIIFLSLLKNLPLIEQKYGRTESASEQPDGCYNDIGSALGMTRNKTPEGVSYNMEITEVNLSKAFRETGADIGNMMSWLIINFFGIALMWMVVFATLKTNEFTKGVADSIDKTAKEFMGTIPIVPVGGGLGLSALQKAPQLLREKYVDSRVNEQQQLLDGFIEESNASSAPETKALQKKFVEGQKDPSKLESLNSNNIPQSTDFLTDYQSAAKAYAQKAKSFYFDDNGNLNTAGTAYATGNNLTSGDIKSSLDSVDKRENALNNQEFVHYMHHGESNGYDKFIQKRDTRRNKTNSTANVMEGGLKEMIKKRGGAHGEKAADDGSVHWYRYDNKSKLTLYKRDLANKQFSHEEPKTYDIDNTITESTATTQLKEKDIIAFNQIIQLGKDQFTELGLVKCLEKLENETEIVIANNKKYKPIKQEGTNILLGFEEVTTP